ncbi:MAG TPA: TIGR00730 family Rossman fold protein [Dysgonamonadaceae bacterium]|nr:TIGR00730 family Rossman fold protein [Dysgonamonadaceae bacterium]
MSNNNSSHFADDFGAVVYSASSNTIDNIYIDAAGRLGELLAKNNITCINGGGNLGLMRAVIDSVLSHGGKVKGVIPKFMVDSGWCHQELSEQIVTDTMHERKQKMAELSSAAIALPGGVGTLEELLEIITWKQLGLYRHPIVILNTNNYYDPLLAMLDNMIDQNFMHQRYRTMWRVVDTPEEAIAELHKQTPKFSHTTKFEEI